MLRGMSSSWSNSSLPRGVVTFLLTDVESSTRLWQTAPDAASLMQRQATIIGG